VTYTAGERVPIQEAILPARGRSAGLALAAAAAATAATRQAGLTMIVTPAP
jgi:hypothetical protein